MTVGERIKKARKAAGMTQKQLAEILNFSYVNISQLENNQRTPGLETLKRIAAALDVPVPELMGMEQIDKVTWGHEAGPEVYKKLERNYQRHRLERLSDAKAHKAGYIQFKSDEDRIAFFYSHLNTDGKLAASKRFYQQLDKASIREVADYVEELSEIPQYQRPSTAEPPPPPSEGEDTAAGQDAAEGPQEGE